MKHLFVDAPLEGTHNLLMCKENQHRLIKVLRWKPGQKFAVFNGKEGLWQAELLSKTEIEIQTQLKPQPELYPRHLYICLPKRETMDRVLRQATEMGVSDIYPLTSEFTVPDKLNLERVQSLVVEASEQCERLSLPTVHPVQPLLAALENAPDLLWCYERKHTEHHKVVRNAEGVLVGPEGGFSPAEVGALKEMDNVHAISLGETILRVDTAVVVGLAQI